MKERVTIMGFNVDPLTMDESLEVVQHYISNRIPCQHTGINSDKVVLAKNDKRLTKIINNSQIINADGMSLVWAAKFLRIKLPERVAGIDQMERIIAMSEEKGYRVYFFGAKEEVVKATVDVYKKKYPKLIIAGYRNGYFKDDENDEIINEMKKSKADVLFVGFTSPKKEFWLEENMSRTGIPFCMGVGGSFDVISGKLKRAPLFMQKVGLEWLFRLVQEPKRLWKRYLIGNIIFIYYVICEKIKLVFGGKGI
ncbi:WecB/TagA/CpsF family glycosyltransferase [Clostridium sp. YIM B02551]|uniref:WecB/TagA/CpsF family glycosyltransferase n=1 Tax=Clostridium sp. YIM B02551 TaxID=2910679 RepID=UPI001EEA8AFA|nr:WecB/TagA/CpsF family glycosyltransferase [Clostridium sp. YIM B02551]